MIPGILYGTMKQVSYIQGPIIRSGDTSQIDSKKGHWSAKKAVKFTDAWKNAWARWAPGGKFPVKPRVAGWETKI